MAVTITSCPSLPKRRARSYSMQLDAPVTKAGGRSECPFLVFSFTVSCSPARRPLGSATPRRRRPGRTVPGCACLRCRCLEAGNRKPGLEPARALDRDGPGSESLPAAVALDWFGVRDAGEIGTVAAQFGFKVPGKGRLGRLTGPDGLWRRLVGERQRNRRDRCRPCLLRKPWLALGMPDRQSTTAQNTSEPGKPA